MDVPSAWVLCAELGTPLLTFEHRTSPHEAEILAVLDTAGAHEAAVARPEPEALAFLASRRPALADAILQALPYSSPFVVRYARALLALGKPTRFAKEARQHSKFPERFLAFQKDSDLTSTQTLRCLYDLNLRAGANASTVNEPLLRYLHGDDTALSTDAAAAAFAQAGLDQVAANFVLVAPERWVPLLRNDELVATLLERDLIHLATFQPFPHATPESVAHWLYCASGRALRQLVERAKFDKTWPDLLDVLEYVPADAKYGPLLLRDKELLERIADASTMHLVWALATALMQSRPFMAQTILARKPARVRALGAALAMSDDEAAPAILEFVLYRFGAVLARPVDSEWTLALDATDSDGLWVRAQLARHAMAHTKTMRREATYDELASQYAKKTTLTATELLNAGRVPVVGFDGPPPAWPAARRRLFLDLAERCTITPTRDSPILAAVLDGDVPAGIEPDTPLNQVYLGSLGLHYALRSITAPARQTLALTQSVAFVYGTVIVDADVPRPYVPATDAALKRCFSSSAALTQTLSAHPTLYATALTQVPALIRSSMKKQDVLQKKGKARHLAVLCDAAVADAPAHEREPYASVLATQRIVGTPEFPALTACIESANVSVLEDLHERGVNLNEAFDRLQQIDFSAWTLPAVRPRVNAFVTTALQYGYNRLGRHLFQAALETDDPDLLDAAAMCNHGSFATFRALLFDRPGPLAQTHPRLYAHMARTGTCRDF